LSRGINGVFSRKGVIQRSIEAGPTIFASLTGAAVNAVDVEGDPMTVDEPWRRRRRGEGISGYGQPRDKRV
jgi:hypothetical protein